LRSAAWQPYSPGLRTSTQPPVEAAQSQVNGCKALALALSSAEQLTSWRVGAAQLARLWLQLPCRRCLHR
jgi:hypothetical protein